MKSISVIVPCFNYEKLVVSKVKKLIKRMENFKIKYEIIVIDDCSPDNTFFNLKKSIKKKNVSIIKNPFNRGKSYSIKKALKISKYNHVILIDCDLPYFEKINSIILKMKQNVDFVSVNRRLKSSRLINKNLSSYQIFRHYIGQLISQIIKTMLKLNIEACDTQAGLKGFKKDSHFNKNEFVSNRFFLDLELFFLYFKNNKKIHFIPVKYEIAKKSSIKIFDIKNFLIIFELIKVIARCKNLK